MEDRAYYLDEIKINGFEPTPEYKAVMQRQREGKLTDKDREILVNRGYKMKQEKR